MSRFPQKFHFLLSKRDGRHRTKESLRVTFVLNDDEFSPAAGRCTPGCGTRTAPVILPTPFGFSRIVRKRDKRSDGCHVADGPCSAWRRTEIGRASGRGRVSDAVVG